MDEGINMRNIFSLTRNFAKADKEPTSNTDKLSTAIDAAKKYAVKLQDAINLVDKFSEKRCSSLDEMRKIKAEMDVCGNPCCCVTLNSGISILVDMHGNLVATSSRHVGNNLNPPKYKAIK